MTRHALTFFPDAMVNFRDLLQRLQMQSQILFNADCWISGDPNPTNWGIRLNGAVVLYDWERFGRGTPALDLAITIPGLGNEEAFRAVAAGYLSINTAADKADQLALDDLDRAIALAKVWSVVEFLSMTYDGHVADTTGVAPLVQALPAWLTRVATMATR